MRIEGEADSKAFIANMAVGVGLSMAYLGRGVEAWVDGKPKKGSLASKAGFVKRVGDAAALAGLTFLAYRWWKDQVTEGIERQKVGGTPLEVQDPGSFSSSILDLLDRMHPVTYLPDIFDELEGQANV